MAKTIFIDLDGTIVKHNYTPLITPDVLLPGALEFLTVAMRAGHTLILTTNRNIDECIDTLSMLQLHGIKFRDTLCGIPVGIRILINDNKDNEIRAVAIPVERDKGLENIIV
jgi:hypothetical protein